MATNSETALKVAQCRRQRRGKFLSMHCKLKENGDRFICVSDSLLQKKIVYSLSLTLSFKHFCSISALVGFTNTIWWVWQEIQSAHIVKLCTVLPLNHEIQKYSNWLIFIRSLSFWISNFCYMISSHVRNALTSNGWMRRFLVSV